MIDSYDKEILITALATVLLLLAIVGLVMWLSATSCKSQASALGLPCTWGPLQGCIVTRKDGVRVDIGNYGRSDTQ